MSGFLSARGFFWVDDGWGGRVRISSCGVLDVLFYDTPQELLYMQVRDLSDLEMMRSISFRR